MDISNKKANLLAQVIVETIRARDSGSLEDELLVWNLADTIKNTINKKKTKTKEPPHVR